MKRSLTLQSLLIIFLSNAFLITLYFFMLKYVFKGINDWTDPFPALEFLTMSMGNPERATTVVLFGAGALITIISWLLISFFGNRLLSRNLQDGTGPSIQASKTPKKDKKDSLFELRPVKLSQRAKIQTLVILQREGRLIDFLQEDLSQCEDAQIGAAVRSIHSGCKESLTEYIDIEPIFDDEEGEEVVVPQGFDSKAIQLTGNITGNPPFRGILRHRGWRAAQIRLPQLSSQEDENNVLAPAEVEVV